MSDENDTQEQVVPGACGEPEVMVGVATDVGTAPAEPAAPRAPRTQKVSVPRAVLQAVLDSLPAGIEVSETSGFTKLTAPGGKLYVQKGENVRQVDLSGFGAGLPGTVAPARENGAVQAQLDLTVGADAAAANLRAAIEHLAALPAPAAPAPKAPKEPKPPKEPKAAKEPRAAKEPKEKKARTPEVDARLAAIKERMKAKKDAAAKPAEGTEAHDAVTAHTLSQDAADELNRETGVEVAS